MFKTILGSFLRRYCRETVIESLRLGGPEVPSRNVATLFGETGVVGVWTLSVRPLAAEFAVVSIRLPKALKSGLKTSFSYFSRAESGSPGLF